MELPTNITSTNLADGDVAIRYLREQEAIRRARTKRRWITFGIVLASLFVLMVGCGIAVGAASGTASTTPAPSAATEVPADAGLREETRIVPAPPVADSAAVTAPAAPVGPYPPAAAFGEGMWTVGTDAEITPGTYRSPGPTEDTMPMCYVDAKIGDRYAAQEVSDAGPVRITLAEGQTVSTNGCQQFVKVS